MELATDQGEPLQQLILEEMGEIVGPRPTRGGAIPAQAAQAAVEGAVAFHAGLVPTAFLDDKRRMNVARSLAHQVIDFALPPRCPGCGTIILKSHSFCLECWTSLELLGEPSCACCGLPFAFEGQGGDLCGACLAEPPIYDRLRAAVAYGPVARKVALKLKYGGRPGVAQTLAGLMGRHIDQLPLDALIAPVPLHSWRIWKRGYNQAALIARSLKHGRQQDLRLDLLRRVKATPSLRGLGRRERALAVRGALAVDPGTAHRLAGKTVVLVDDVYTSGATANACARALKRAGAARVEVVCWARVIATTEG